MLAALRRSAGHVTPVGRALLLLLGTALLVTRLTGLAEFAVIAWLSALLLVVGLPFVLLPTRTRGHRSPWIVSVSRHRCHRGQSNRNSPGFSPRRRAFASARPSSRARRS